MRDDATVFKHTPVIRHITAANVDRYGPWARVLFDMYVAAARNESRWEMAYFANDDEEAPDDVKRVRSKAVEDRRNLSMLLALEVAGRLDGDRLGDEIVKCITTPEGNMPETIVKRLFKVKYTEWLDYHWRQRIDRLMERMIRKGRLGRNYGWGRTQTKYFVITPEYLERRRREREDAILQEAQQKAQEARQEAVLKVLKSRGYQSARAKSYSDVEVVLSVTDVEQLLGIAAE